MRTTIIVFFVTALVIGGVVSYWASSNPDGLDRSIEDHGLQPAGGAAEPAQQQAALAEAKAENQAKSQSEDKAEGQAEGETGSASPLADYKVLGISNEFLSNGLAGIAGALLVLAVLLMAGWALTRGRRAATSVPGGDSAGSTH